MIKSRKFIKQIKKKRLENLLVKANKMNEFYESPIYLQMIRSPKKSM
jgi:hypothetical protein